MLSPHKYIAIICLMTVLNTCSFAQNRFIRPLQFQLNHSGLLDVSLGNMFNDRSKKRVQVQDWITPGLEAGFHLSRSFYLGYGMDPSRHIITREYMTMSNSAPEGDAHVEMYALESHRVNLRYFPLKVDAYAEFGAMLKGSVNHEVIFSRSGESAKYGENFYATDLSIVWRRPSRWMPTLGMGYNWVYRSGFSFDLGFTVPLDVLERPELDIDLEETQENIELSAEDAELLRKYITHYTFFSPVSFRLNVGYNLRFEKRKTQPYTKVRRQKKQERTSDSGPSISPDQE